MNKKIRLYQWISYFIFICTSTMIGLYFIDRSKEYMSLYFEDFMTPLVAIVVLIVVGIMFLIQNFKYTNKHMNSFHYLQKEVIPYLMISEEEHQKAIKLYEKYMLKAYIFHALTKILGLTVCFIAVFIIDLLIFVYDSSVLLLIIDVVVWFILMFLLLILLNKILDKSYEKYVITILDENSRIFIDISYMFLCNDLASLPCPFTYKMNIVSGLSRIGEYEYANIYMKQLWREEKVSTRRGITQIIYYFNCYIFSIRLHLGDSDEYRNMIEHILVTHPRLTKATSVDFVLKRIEIEEAFLHEDFQCVIKMIKEFQMKRDKQKISVYYDYMLYSAYKHLNDDINADKYYNRSKDHILFQKLVELEGGKDHGVS